MSTLAGNNLSSNTPDASQFKFGFMSSLEEPWEAVELMVSSLGGGCSDWRELFLHDALNVHTDESPLASRRRHPRAASVENNTHAFICLVQPPHHWLPGRRSSRSSIAAFIASLIALTLLCKTHPWLFNAHRVRRRQREKDSHCGQSLSWGFKCTSLTLPVNSHQPACRSGGGGGGGGAGVGTQKAIQLKQSAVYTSVFGVPLWPCHLILVLPETGSGFPTEEALSW